MLSFTAVVLRKVYPSFKSQHVCSKKDTTLIFCMVVRGHGELTIIALEFIVNMYEILTWCILASFYIKNIYVKFSIWHYYLSADLLWLTCKGICWRCSCTEGFGHTFQDTGCLINQLNGDMPWWTWPLQAIVIDSRHKPKIDSKYIWQITNKNLNAISFTSVEPRTVLHMFCSDRLKSFYNIPDAPYVVWTHCFWEVDIIQWETTTGHSFSFYCFKLNLEGFYCIQLNVLGLPIVCQGTCEIFIE